MNKKIVTFFSVLIIIAFIGFMIFDSVKPDNVTESEEIVENSDRLPDSWKVSGEFLVKEGSLKAVTVTSNGRIVLGGDSFLSCYDKNLNLIWSIKTPNAITSIASSYDTVFASTIELIMVISGAGKIEEEWGPFESNSIITSLSANISNVAFADAGNKMVFILDKKGEVRSLLGQSGDEFILPSPYFDLVLDSGNRLFVANTGHRRIETRSFDGKMISSFGEPGTAPGAFCGCCNPAHFIVIPDGFVTAEKGINRIKILNRTGEFVEFVSSKNKFVPSVPLDLASADGMTIYAVNPADSKLYVFTRK